jgi:transcriptional regulator NrdR family protein
MMCPVCNAWAYVKETRRQPDNEKLRRYECGNLHRFTTMEQVAKVMKPRGKKNGQKPDQ